MRNYTLIDDTPEAYRISFWTLQIKELHHWLQWL